MAASGVVTIVDHASPPPNSMSRFHLLLLPTEIRLDIYKTILSNARIELIHKEIAGKSFNLIGTLKLIQHKRAAICLTSKHILDEALPIATQYTHVVVGTPYPQEDRTDLLACLSPNFMSQVQHITLPQEYFMRTNRSLLTKLKKVTLADFIGGCLSLNQFHFTTCIHHGGYTGDELHLSYMTWGSDWNWRRKQFLYLAEEGGYDIEVNLFVHFKNAGLRCEWIFDLRSGDYSHKRLLKGVEVLDVGEEDKHGEDYPAELYGICSADFNSKVHVLDPE